MTVKEKSLENLREKGHRITNQRRQLLSFFCNLKENEHLSAEDLHKKLVDKNIKISLATLYRSLKFLAENGFLTELDFGEAHKHYELKRSNKSHFHMICCKCGLTADFCDEELEKDIKKAISRNEDFEIKNYEFKITGLCKKCR